jgi:3-hydroxyisobutyrate dehydrogenase
VTTNERSEANREKIGFIGLGSMGEPMAQHLEAAGTHLVVWNRSEEKLRLLEIAGAEVAGSVDELFERVSTVIIMLANSTVIDQVLGRNSDRFVDLVRGHLVINMGTVAPTYSQRLCEDVTNAGGEFIEAPVSGTRKPAQDAALVAMVAGEASVTEKVSGLFNPMCREVIVCGEIPNALMMKLSLNVFLIALVSGLAECVHFAENNGVDRTLLLEAISSSHLSSDFSRVKLPKLLTRDFDAQARISDVLENSQLIVDVAREAGIASPLSDVCLSLFGETRDLDLANADTVAVLRAIEKRTNEIQGRHH